MDLRTKLSLDGSDFGKTLEDASKQVGDFQKKTEDASKSVEGMGQASSRTASELLKQMKNMEGLGRSAGSYRQQLAQISSQIQDLTINYRSMSDEMKGSDFGKEVAAKIEELKQKASEYKDAIGDAQASVRALASDTANLDAAKMGLEGISAAFSLVTSAGVLSAETTEKLIKVIARLKAIEAATNAVIKIANVLNKDSILMIKLKEVWTKMHTAALVKNTAAQKANNAAVSTGTTKGVAAAAASKGATTAITGTTAAVKGLSICIKGGLIGVIIALIAIFSVWAEKQHQQIALSRKVKTHTEEEKEAFKNYGNVVGTSIGKAIYTFDSLKKKFEDLTTVSQKKQFLEEYKNELAQIGINVRTLNDLEEVFINSSDDYRKAVTARAKALALQSLIQKEYEEAFQNANTKSAEKEYSAGYDFGLQYKPKEFFDFKGLVEGVDYEVIDRDFYGNIFARLTGPGADKMNAAVEQLLTNGAETVARVNTRRYLTQMEQLAEETKGLRLFGGGGSGGGSGDTTASEESPELFDTNSLKAAQQAVTDIQNRLNGMDVNDGFFNYWVEELDIAKARVKEIQDMMNVPMPAKPVQMIPPETGLTLKAAQDEVSRLQTMLRETVPNTEEFNHIAQALQNWQAALEGIQSQYDAVTKKAAAAADATNEIGSGSIVSNINNIASSLGSMNSSIASLYTSWRDLGKNIDETEDGFEAFLNTLGVIFSTMQTITGVMETINSLEAAFNALGAIGLATQQATNVAKSEEMAEETALTGVKATNATIDTVGAAANVAKSASAIPVVGWVLALGAVAAIIAMIAGAGNSLNFANGGIVPGTSFSGDKIQANLNSGEMVLNTQQQRNLFNLLDGKSTYSNGGKVEFVIKGQELKGVLNNYDKKMSRV